LLWQIAGALGLQNAYTCQLFLGQAQLKPDTAEKLKDIVPQISDQDLAAMQLPPMRGFDAEILKEPNVYRTYEAITHYGEAIKMLINEQCGDGIMSAIDFYLDVGNTVGTSSLHLLCFSSQTREGLAFSLVSIVALSRMSVSQESRAKSAWSSRSTGNFSPLSNRRPRYVIDSPHCLPEPVPCRLSGPISLPTCPG
jgi:cyanate lyase